MSAPVTQHFQECEKRKLIAPEKKGAYALLTVSFTEHSILSGLSFTWRLVEGYCTADELERHVVVVVNQLRRGEALITSQDERSALAKLSLMAAKEAVQASSSPLEAEYLSHGIALLSTNCWEEEYELSPDLHCSNAEVLYAIPDFDQMNKMIKMCSATVASFMIS